MSYIGRVIYEMRIRNGMGRQELAEDICTEKYIYLMERGQRNPSAEMTAKLGDKLGIDLFEYYDYLDAQEPVLVHDYIDQMNYCRYTMNYEKIMEITQEALKQEDFHKSPWKYEVELNNVMSMLFLKEDWKAAIPMIQSQIEATLTVSSLKQYSVDLYVLLSTAYQMGGDIVNAEVANSKAYDVLQKNIYNRRYTKLAMSINLNKMTLYYFTKKYEESIQLGLSQIKMNAKNHSYDRLHFVYMYMAYAYYESGMEKEAFQYFEKGLGLIILYERNIEAYYIASFSSFPKMIQDSRVRSDLATEFLQMLPEDITQRL